MKPKQIKIESNLIKLGFKRVWFDDKSGYWFEKNFKYKDLYMQLMAEPDRKILCLQIRVDKGGSLKLKLNSYYDACYQKKFSIKNVKELIKRYK